MALTLSSDEVRRMVAHPECTGTLDSQRDHLVKMGQHMRTLAGDKRHADEYEKLALQLSDAVQAQTWGEHMTVLGLGGVVSLCAHVALAMRRSRRGEKEKQATGTTLLTAIPFAAMMLVGSLANLVVQWRQAKRLSKALRTQDTVAFPLMIPLHAMMMQFKKQKDGNFTLRIYNTGGGLQNHLATRRDAVPTAIGDRGPGKKMPTAFEVRDIPASTLTCEELRKICGVPIFRNPLHVLLSQLDLGEIAYHGAVKSVYWDWAASKGQVHKVALLQKQQTSGNCTYKSAVAYIKHNLTPPAFQHFRASWLRAAAESYRPHDREDLPLQAALQAKALRAERRCAG